MPVVKAALSAFSSPSEDGASTTATSLSRPGKSTAGETEAFIAAILARPAVRGGGRAKPGLCQEIGDGGAEAVEIDQERVVALRRLERQEVRLRATRAQAVGDLLLLLQREQDVGVPAARQRPLHPDPRQALVGGAAAGLSDVVPVHRAAQVPVAVGIEIAHETATGGLEGAYAPEPPST